MKTRVRYLLCAALVLGLCAVSWGQVKATNPSPADGALDVVVPLVRWTPGIGTMMANVYFGTTPDLGPEQLVQAQNPSPLYYHGPGLVPGTTYYWRVDGILADGTVIEGDVWSFLAFPLTAYHPSPADGSLEAPISPVLTWLAGQNAQGHHVYFSADEAAVADAAAGADKGSTEDPNYAAGELLPVTTYYWRVDELQMDASELAGDVWSFTTVLPIDDFETYTNDVGSRAFEVWIDGVGFSLPEPGNPGNGTGAAVGHDIWTPGTDYTTIMETDNAASGDQAMPVYFDNSAAPFYSQVDRSWSVPQDWTAQDLSELTLQVRGEGVNFIIPRADPAPVIDGEIDDVWALASIQEITIPITNAPADAADSSGTFRLLYDDENLFLLAEVTDESLINDTAETWQDDSVEFYIDGDNTKGPAGLSGNARQYTFGWTTDDVQGTNTNVQGFEHGQVDTADGWRLEVKMPWQSLMGRDAPVGELIGTDCFINDDDDGTDRDSQISWHAKEGDGWQTPSMWGTALVAAPAAPDSADRLYVAVQDSANGTAVVTHPDPGVVTSPTWVQWKIALSEFVDAGVNLAAVRQLSVGVGDPENPVAGGTGVFFLDDIYLNQTPPEPVPPALLAHYQFENDVTDASGNGLDGTPVGEPSYVEGLADYGMAMDFDGVDDLVELGQFDVDGQITLAAWARPDSFAINDARIISKAKEWGGDDHWWMVSTISETSLRFRLKTDDGEGTATLISDPVLEAGAWAHVAVTWGGSTMRIYKDGVEVASQEKGGSAVAVDPAVSVAIGSQPSDAFATDPTHVEKFFDGLIDEVRIYDGALSAEEIAELAGL